MDFAVNSPNYAEPNAVYVFLGNGDGTFQAPISYTGMNQAGPLAVGDFNGDGIADLFAIVPGGEGMIAFGNGDGTFQTASTVYSGPTIYSPVIADFNGDGKADLAFTVDNYPNPGTVGVLLGNGDGTFQTETNATVTSYFALGLTAADLNGDGKADLVVVNYQNVPGEPQIFEFSILLGNGNGTFQPAINYVTANSVDDIAIGDFNGDGIPDVALAIYGGQLSIDTGNGDGTFQAPTNYTVDPFPIEPGYLAVADFNSDGRADIAIANYSLSNAGPIGVVINSVFGSTTTALTSLPKTSTYGQTVTLTAQVTPPTASGTVTFYDATTLLGSGTLNAGVATYLHSTLAAGSHALTAAYAGDSFDSGSTSPVFTQTVGLATPSVRIKSSPNPSTFGQEVNFTATVLSPGGVTGSVSFYRNSRLLGTAGLAGDSANFG